MWSHFLWSTCLVINKLPDRLRLVIQFDEVVADAGLAGKILGQLINLLGQSGGDEPSRRSLMRTIDGIANTVRLAPEGTLSSLWDTLAALSEQHPQLSGW